MAAIAACGLALAACASEGTATDVDAKWAKHVDDAGFEISAPSGWDITTEGGSTISVTSPEGAKALARPFLADDGTTPADCADAPEDQFGDVMTGLAADTEASLVGDADATSSFTYDDGVGGMLCHIDGRAGMAFAIAAPAAVYTEQRATLVKVLGTLQFSAPTRNEAPPIPALDFTEWRDPNEGAFTIEVPSDWDVAGGLSRHSALDVRTAVELTSPDGAITVTLGSDDAGFFTPPSAMLEAGGIYQGDVYEVPGGYSVVAPYLPGSEFAAFLVTSGSSSVCGTTSIEDSTDRSELAQPVYDRYQSAGLNQVQSVDAGEVSYTCSTDRGDLAGWQFALTTDVLNGAVEIWVADPILGYVAPTDGVAAAQAVVQHLAATYRRDPDWEARQQGTTMEVSRIAAETNAAISESISESYWTRQESLDRVYDEWSKATLGQTDVRDPDTGETWRVESGHNYYWSTDTGELGASETAPDIDVTLLEQI